MFWYRTGLVGLMKAGCTLDHPINLDGIFYVFLVICVLMDFFLIDK